MGLSIRWRLTFWNTLALAVALALLGGLVWGLMARTHQRIDHTLRERATAALRRVDQSLLGQVRQVQQDGRMGTDSPARLRYWIHEFKEHDNTFCVVYDA